jgi:hypothetical protein
MEGGPVIVTKNVYAIHIVEVDRPTVAYSTWNLWRGRGRLEFLTWMRSDGADVGVWALCGPLGGAPGTYHGFAVRGDERVPAIEEAKRDALQQTVTFLLEHV